MNIINCLSLIDEKGNVLGYFGGYDTEDKPILVTKEEIDKIKQFNTNSNITYYKFCISPFASLKILEHIL